MLFKRLKSRTEFRAPAPPAPPILSGQRSVGSNFLPRAALFLPLVQGKRGDAIVRCQAGTSTNGGILHAVSIQITLIWKPAGN